MLCVSCLGVRALRFGGAMIVEFRLVWSICRVAVVSLVFMHWLFGAPLGERLAFSRAFLSVLLSLPEG